MGQLNAMAKRKPPKASGARGKEVGQSRTFVKLAHTLSEPTLRQLERFAYLARVNKSSIVEAALTMLFDSRDDERVIAILKEHGARIRRSG